MIFGTNRLNLAQSQDNLAQLYSAQAHYAKAVENLYCLSPKSQSRPTYAYLDTLVEY